MSICHYRRLNGSRFSNKNTMHCMGCRLPNINISPYQVHSGEKPYICGICGKTAATRSNYNSHLRTHITRYNTSYILH